MLDKLKRTFSAGGVKVTLRPPRILKPKNPTVPITVILRNRAKEERTVEDILFVLAERSERDERNDPARRSDGIEYLVDEAITLQPGQSHEFTIDMPTTVTGAAEAAGVELPGWAKTADTLLNSVRHRPRAYEIRATTHVRGFNVAKTVTRDLGAGFSFG